MSDLIQPPTVSPGEFSREFLAPSRWKHPAIRALQWCLVSAVLLCILAFAVFAVLFEMSDPGPPRMLRSTECESGSDECYQVLEKVIARRFPIGTPVSSVVAALAREGFKDKLDDNVPVPAALNTRYYVWGKFPCGQFAIIEWSADIHGNISHIGGSYQVRCV